MTHTQGPWTLNAKNCALVVCGHNIVADCQHTAFTLCTEIANARLIAAAPDLLEALIELDQHMQSSGLEYPTGTFEIVQAAIAKARGQS